MKTNSIASSIFQLFVDSSLMLSHHPIQTLRLDGSEIRVEEDKSTMIKSKGG